VHKSWETEVLRTKQLPADDSTRITIIPLFLSHIARCGCGIGNNLSPIIR